MRLLFYSKGSVRLKGILGREIIDNYSIVSSTKFMFIRLGLRIRGPPI